MQLTSKLDTITQISTRSTTHFTTDSNSTHPCTTHHLAIPSDMQVNNVYPSMHAFKSEKLEYSKCFLHCSHLKSQEYYPQA